MTLESANEPIEGLRGASILGPKNLARQGENSDILVPPSTDNGTLFNLKWSFADSPMRLEAGGWARQTTVRELPVATAMAGVNMRLKAGAIREMHWHSEAEWAYMIAGQARITAIDQNGCAFQDDVSAGDLWYFPAGIPHSIQGLGEEGCEFLLVFDEGDFSENATFLLTDWLAHTPKDILEKNFQVPKGTFDSIPDRERYIFPGKLPPPLAEDRVRGAGPVAQLFSHRLLEQTPLRTKSGRVRIADSTNFPIAQNIASALVEVEPGGLRELHWHPNSDEWQYYLAGQGRMTVFGAETQARTFDFQAGDVGYVPCPMGHYIENTGTTTLSFLEIFRSARFVDISLAQWLAFTPKELVQAHLNLDVSFLASIPSNKWPIVP